MREETSDRWDADRVFLAGDVGATKTTLGLFSQRGNAREARVEETFRSKDFDSLEEVVRDFLAKNEGAVRFASFGVAGPVVGGRAETTNLGWVLEEAALEESLGLEKVHLLNDLEAMATGIPFLTRSDLSVINRGEPDRGGSVAVIGPGSGLGEAFITWDDRGRVEVHPSEGGHSDFAPTNDLEVRLLRYLKSRFGHVSYERVCSGQGILNIHSFLLESGRREGPAWHTKALEAELDPVPSIARAALSKSPRRCETCKETFEVFASILGAEAGNLALKVMATRGTYIGGGIPRKVLPIMKEGAFLKSFKNKGRMSELISRIPVYVVLNPRTALMGAARAMLDRIHPVRRVPRGMMERAW